MTSIIDLTCMIPDIGALDTWVINDVLETPSNHKVIVADLADPERKADSIGTSQEITG